MAKSVKPTYEIIPSNPVSGVFCTMRPEAIKCLVCGMVSYNKNDIEQKYCGNCHQFHDIMMAQRELEKDNAKM